MTLTIQLEYFKRSGKYYSSGTLEVEVDSYYEVIDIIHQHMMSKTLPDLVPNHSDFIVHANEETIGFPILMGL